MFRLLRILRYKLSRPRGKVEILREESFCAEGKCGKKKNFLMKLQCYVNNFHFDLIFIDNIKFLVEIRS